MNLKHLTDSTLHTDTLKLVGRERELTTQILHHLKEIDRRKLYSDYKCSSLFSYCTTILKLSESSAQRRISAARLLADLPEIEEKIESGSLTLSILGQASSFFKDQEITSSDEKMAVLAQIEDQSARGCEKILFDISGDEKPLPKEKEKRVSKDKTQLTINLSDETLEEVAKLKALLGKNMSMDELIKFMTKVAIQKVEKEKFKTTTQPKKETALTNARTPSAAVKRAVKERDKCCTQCGSSHNLNYDHRIAAGVGGKSNLSNIRLLCFNCNQRSRIRMRL